MKIALVSRYYNKRQGIPHDVAELAERFVREHEVHVFTQVWEDVEDERIIFHKVPAVLPKSFLNELFFFWIAGFMLRRYEFDVINFHDPCFCESGVFTSHAFPRAGIEAVLEYNRLGNTGIPSAALLPFKLFFPISDYNMTRRRRNRVIAVSSVIKSKIVSLLRRPEEEIDVVPNGINPIRFNHEAAEKYRLQIRRETGLEEKDFVLLFVGYYHLRKGLQFLIPALAGIEDPEVKVLVVGNDTVGREYIRELIRQHGLEKRIIFAGDQKDVEKYFAAGDGLVLPALYEPFGNVVLEAMGCRLPVILSRQAGASDLIVDGENGLLIDNPLDTAALTEKIGVLYRNPEHRSRMAEAGYKTALRYSWDYVAEKTMDVFQKHLLEKTNEYKKKSRGYNPGNKELEYDRNGNL